MAAEPVPAPKISAPDSLTSNERQELERLRAYRRRRHMEQMIAMGAFGLGVMFAGFGPLGALGGMLLGGIAGYLVVRRDQTVSAKLQS
jgi:hypothetical protein